VVATVRCSAYWAARAIGWLPQGDEGPLRQLGQHVAGQVCDRCLMSSRLLVLAWHNVDPTWCFPARQGAGARGLTRQLAFLARRCNVVPLGDALAALDRREPLPPRAVALTFDDGYRDQLELAAPMLAQLGLPATFFLVPGLLDRTARPWWEELGWIFSRSSRDVVVVRGRTFQLGSDAERRQSLLQVLEDLKRRDQTGREAAIDELRQRCAPQGKLEEQASFLDWSGARELARRGFTVASHSLNHAILAEEPPSEQERDLALSRELLERELDLPVLLLAYPNGKRSDYSAATVAAAHRAGYSHALTTLDGWNRPATASYEARRFVIQPERGTPGLALVPLRSVRARARAVRDRRR
jgi:peptidoglycan/xylan/chitin deacetylase (PgdA/CDA1 family)